MRRTGRILIGVLLLGALAGAPILAPRADAESTPAAEAPSEAAGRIGFVGHNIFGAAHGVFHVWRVVEHQVDLADPTASHAVVEVTLASVDTKTKGRDDHLRTPDFFDVEKYPEISVVVTEATATGERTADLRAELTVRGTTHPLPLSATVEGVGEGRDKDTVRISAQTSIDRTAFGVSGNMVGMMPATTTLIADLVFTKA